MINGLTISEIREQYGSVANMAKVQSKVEFTEASNVSQRVTKIRLQKKVDNSTEIKEPTVMEKRIAKVRKEYKHLSEAGKAADKENIANYIAEQMAKWGRSSSSVKKEAVSVH